MKFAYLSGCVVAVALVLSSSTPSFARGGGHGGGHGGHGGRGGHAHAHAFAHHGAHAHAFAHHAGFAGHHFAANHNFAHNHTGWNHGWGHGGGWGRGWGWGAGRGWWGRGWGGSGYWGTRYAGGWWPGYLAAGIVNPSYYCQYLNGVTTTAVPTPVMTTQSDVTNIVQPVAPSAVPVDVATPGTPTEEDAAPLVSK
jgi:hypothetical protein